MSGLLCLASTSVSCSCMLPITVGGSQLSMRAHGERTTTGTPSRQQRRQGARTSMGLPEPGRRTPTKLPSDAYTATVWKSRATTDAPCGGRPAAGSSDGTNVAHSLPLTPGVRARADGAQAAIWVKMLPAAAP